MKLKLNSGWIWVLAAFFLVLIIYLLLWAFHDRSVSRCNCDLNNDGIEEELELVGGRGSYADFFTISAGGKEFYRIDLKAINPWKVQTADVDGDGEMEISLGVFKTTRTDPVMSKRPFIYNWDEKGLHPKWLGSRLSRPFDDYVFYDMDQDGMDELIAIEHLADGSKVINSYEWKGFGFESIGESGSFQDIKALKAITEEDKLPEADIKERGKWRHAILIYTGGGLILK